MPRHFRDGRNVTPGSQGTVLTIPPTLQRLPFSGWGCALPDPWGGPGPSGRPPTSISPRTLFFLLAKLSTNCNLNLCRASAGWPCAPYTRHALSRLCQIITRKRPPLRLGCEKTGSLEVKAQRQRRCMFSPARTKRRPMFYGVVLRGGWFRAHGPGVAVDDRPHGGIVPLRPWFTARSQRWKLPADSQPGRRRPEPAPRS